MKNLILLFTLGILLQVSIGCKKKNNNPRLDAIAALAEKVNSTPNKKLSNGTILSKCEYKKGDSLFVYFIKVDDKRFDNITADSIKSSLVSDLKSEEMNNISKTLKRNSIGIKYIFNTEKKDIEITLSPQELP